MRIVSGELKGRRFSPPRNFKARPTTDFAKENIFNVLNNIIDFEDVAVLDLFSGTGSISYEFASRGATDIIAIENNYKHFKYISKTVQKLNLEDQIIVFKSCAFRYIKKTTASFDIVFADPPYDMKEAETLPEKVLKSGILKPDGMFIFEHSDKKEYSHTPRFSEVRKYGKVNFSIFRV